MKKNNDETKIISIYGDDKELLDKFKYFDNNPKKREKFISLKNEVIEITNKTYQEIFKMYEDESLNDQIILLKRLLKQTVNQQMTYDILSHMLSRGLNATLELLKNVVKKYCPYLNQPHLEVLKDGKKFKFIKGRLIELND
ncbi:hypothetical protein K8R66_02435 [bacterium]|nr:hypothetical protein [bacterium]